MNKKYASGTIETPMCVAAAALKVVLWRSVSSESVVNVATIVRMNHSRQRIAKTWRASCPSPQVRVNELADLDDRVEDVVDVGDRRLAGGGDRVGLRLDHEDDEEQTFEKCSAT